MNYFELYNIPVSLQPDKNVIRQRYYELSRRYHPDFFSNANDEEKEDALEKSSAVNKAFKTFQNDDETIKYVLQQKQLLEEEEKFILPPAFLSEVLELNEQLMEARLEDDDEKVTAMKTQISNLQNEIYEPVKKIIEHYKEGVTAKEELLQVKDYYYKKKYLNRILAGMQ